MAGSGYYVRNNIIYVQGSVDGRFYRISTTKEATPLNLKWISKNSRDVLLNLIAKEKPCKPIYFIEYARLSLQNNAYMRRSSTNKDYEADFTKKIAPKFKNFTLKDIKPSDIKAWQNKLLDGGLSAKRVKNLRTVFSTILNDAMADDLIDKNPIEMVKPPKIEQTEIHPFSLKDVTTILGSAKGWFKNFLSVAFFTGARTGELLALKWEDVNFDSNTIHIRRSIRRAEIGKTKTETSNRVIDMLPPVKKALMEQFKTNGLAYEWIFTSSRNTHFTESSSILKNHWRPLLKRCLIDYRMLYQTRHTFASIMLQQREDIGWVSQMLGHKNIATTLKFYAKYIEEKTVKRASFLDNFMKEDCTVITHKGTLSA